MANRTTYIKIDRNIIRWEWWDSSPATLKVWLWLLVNANVVPHQFEGLMIKRGQIVTSLESLARENRMTTQNIRTILSRLTKTGEITKRNIGNQYTLITITHYDKYQDKTEGDKPSTRGSAKKSEDKPQVPNEYRAMFGNDYAAYERWKEQ